MVPTLEKVQTKHCPRCGKIKPLSEFYTRRNGRFAGLPSAYCRLCTREIRRQQLGLTQKLLPLVKRVEDIRGQVFGNYTVLEFAGIAPNNRMSKWLCRCACGAEHVVFKTALRPDHKYCPTCQWEKP
jgi:hypothetical protein